ncbi:MAG: alpha/beta hydrolase [Candidatus Micrarchaeota archaeon]
MWGVHLRFRRRHYLLIAALILAVLAIMQLSYKPEQYFIDKEGRAHYPANRGAIGSKESPFSEDSNYSIQIITFNSNGTTVYSKLWIPNGPQIHPAIIFLPGAGGTKDAGKDYAEIFKGSGIAIMAIDQRGFGETKAQVTESLEDEYASFLDGREPFGVLMAYDAIRAFDYLASREDIDASKIAAIGESLGGRNAIIATAMEPRIKMVIGISTGGYGLPSANNPNATRFLRSFDPDNYITSISPRRAVIFHSENDNLQPFEIGLRTYNFAKEPKAFYRATCASHGLCEEMKPLVLKEITEALK